MDFWDVTKLMLRRWLVTLPLLLMTVAATGYTAMTVHPDHKATGRITMLPPTVRRDDIPGQTRRVNPWTEEALATAAAFRLQNKKLADQVYAEGLTGTWNASVEGRLPVITIEVVAPTDEQAQATTGRLLAEVEREIARRQQNLGVGVVEGEMITSVVYDAGENVEVVDSKTKRTLVVVLAAGLILTVGIVVGLDALLRRRARRKAAAAAAEAAAAEESGMPRAPEPAAPPAPEPARFEVEETRTLKVDNQTTVAMSGGADPVDRADGHDLEHAVTRPLPADATIDLPLSDAAWAGEETVSSSGRAIQR